VIPMLRDIADMSGYCQYTGRRDVTARLRELLLDEGIGAEILRASVSPEKREEWLRKKVSAGTDVVIGNPKLVQTGLDLYDLPLGAAPASENVCWTHGGILTGRYIFQKGGRTMIRESSEDDERRRFGFEARDRMQQLFLAELGISHGLDVYLTENRENGVILEGSPDVVRQVVNNANRFAPLLAHELYRTLARVVVTAGETPSPALAEAIEEHSLRQHRNRDRLAGRARWNRNWLSFVCETRDAADRLGSKLGRCLDGASLEKVAVTLIGDYV